MRGLTLDSRLTLDGIAGEEGSTLVWNDQLPFQDVFLQLQEEMVSETKQQCVHK